MDRKFANAASFALAVKLYEDGKASASEAAAMCGKTRGQFLLSYSMQLRPRDTSII